MANQERQNNQNFKPNWELIGGVGTTIVSADFALTKLNSGTENLSEVGIPLFFTAIGLAFTIQALNEIIAKKNK